MHLMANGYEQRMLCQWKELGLGRSRGDELYVYDYKLALGEGALASFMHCAMVGLVYKSNISVIRRLKCFYSRKFIPGRQQCRAGELALVNRGWKCLN